MKEDRKSFSKMDKETIIPMSKQGHNKLMRGPVNSIYSIFLSYLLWACYRSLPNAGKNFVLHAPNGMDFFKLRTYKVARDRETLTEERTNHCHLRINLHSYPIMPDQS